MQTEALNALRQVIYYKLKMWDASREAEKVLGCDIDTHSNALDYFCAGIGNANDALRLAEEMVRQAFPELDKV